MFGEELTSVTSAAFAPAASRVCRGGRRAAVRPAPEGPRRLSRSVRCTDDQNKQSGSSCPLVSAAAAGFPSSHSALPAAARSASLWLCCPEATKCNSCWTSRERRAFARRPLEGIAAEHDSERLHTLSVAIPPVRSLLHGMSIASRHLAASMVVQGSPPSSGSWPAPNSRLKPTRPRSLAGYCEPHGCEAGMWRAAPA